MKQWCAVPDSTSLLPPPRTRPSVRARVCVGTPARWQACVRQLLPVCSRRDLGAAPSCTATCSRNHRHTGTGFTRLTAPHDSNEPGGRAGAHRGLWAGRLQLLPHRRRVLLPGQAGRARTPHPGDGLGQDSGAVSHSPRHPAGHNPPRPTDTKNSPPRPTDQNAPRREVGSATYALDGAAEIVAFMRGPPGFTHQPRRHACVGHMACG